MTPRRVLMTTDAVGGVWVFTTLLARALAAQGVEVVLAVLGPRVCAERRAAIGDIDGVCLIDTNLSLEWLDPAGHNIDVARNTLACIADDVAPDIVHINGFREASYPWTVPTVVTAHSCVLSWWSATRGSLPTGEWLAYAQNARCGLAAADAWTAPSAVMRDEVIRYYGPPRDGIVIPNGIDLCGSGPPVGVGRTPTIVAAGRVWDEAKNLSVLASIAPELDWPIRIIGSTVSPAGGSALAFDGVEYTGELPHDEVLREFRSAAIFVSPARYEPFGLSVLEAGVSGAALVLSDIPTFRETWGDAALFFDPEDHRALLAAVRTLIADPVFRHDLAGAASERGRRFTATRTASAYLALYSEVLARGHLSNVDSHTAASWNEMVPPQ